MYARVLKGAPCLSGRVRARAEQLAGKLKKGNTRTPHTRERERKRGEGYIDAMHVQVGYRLARAKLERLMGIS